MFACSRCASKQSALLRKDSKDEANAEADLNVRAGSGPAELLRLSMSAYLPERVGVLSSNAFGFLINRLARWILCNCAAINKGLHDMCM